MDFGSEESTGVSFLIGNMINQPAVVAGFIFKQRLSCKSL